MGQLLGGGASPIGWAIQYVQAPAQDVIAAIRQARKGEKLRVGEPRPYPASLQALLPFEAPWTRELVMACGGWTAYLNNFVNGGDATAIGPAIAGRMGVRCVVAQHAPAHGPGHAGTQLWVQGPDGEPPLMYERTLSAVATDGRWQWITSGAPFDFEDVSRYTARRIRDRLDRSLLMRYLAALGIRADDDNAYGPGTLIQQDVDWPVRTQTLQGAQTNLGLQVDGPTAG